MVVLGIPIIVAAIEALIWLLFAELIIGPWMDEQFNHKQPWWKRALLLPARVIRGRLNKLITRVKAEMSHRFIQSEPAVGRLVNRTAIQLEQLSGVIVASNQAALHAFVYIRQTLVPTLIERAVAPIRTKLNNVATRVGELEDRNRQVSTLIAQTLRQLPWGVGGDYVPNFRQWLNSYQALWHSWFDTWQPRVAQLWKEFVPNLKNIIQALQHTVTAIQTEALPAIRLRIGRIETWLDDMATDPTTWVMGLLGAAMIPALSAGGFRTALRNLTCRNTQTLAKNVCAMDETLLTELLAGTLLFSLAIDPKLVVKVGDEVADIMGGVFRTMSDL